MDEVLQWVRWAEKEGYEEKKRVFMIYAFPM